MQYLNWLNGTSAPALLVCRNHSTQKANWIFFRGNSAHAKTRESDVDGNPLPVCPLLNPLLPLCLLLFVLSTPLLIFLELQQVLWVSWRDLPCDHIAGRVPIVVALRAIVQTVLPLGGWLWQHVTQVRMKLDVMRTLWFTAYSTDLHQWITRSGPCWLSDTCVLSYTIWKCKNISNAHINHNNIFLIH